MRVLVIAPHPDDEAIGCGGAICLHGDRGDQVSVVFLTSGEAGVKDLSPEQAMRLREAEAEAAGRILNVRQLYFLRSPDSALESCEGRVAAALEPILRAEAPELIYVPHPEEEHADHQVAWREVRRAVADAGIEIPVIRAYEVWTPMAHYDDGEDIGAAMPRKLQAVRAHASQVGQLRYDLGVQGLNQYRGAIAWACEYAEVFKILHLGDGE